MIGLALIVVAISIMVIAVTYTFVAFPIFSAFTKFVNETPLAYSDQLEQFYSLIITVANIFGILSIIGLFIWCVAYSIKKERYDWRW